MAETLRDAILYFSNFENCKRFMTQLRWADGKIACPICGAEKVTWLEKPRIWKCYGKHPRPRFSLKTGTIFEDSPIALEKWLPALWLISSCKNGISSYEIARDLGVTQKTAWFMLHRIRLAMQTGTFTKLSGVVEADETYVGGKAEFMHMDRRTRMKMAGKLERGGHGKAIVLGLLDRQTRQARVKVVRSPKKSELRGAIGNV